MSRKSADPLPGIPAKWATPCGRCDVMIQPTERIVFARGVPVHVGCAAGADDE